MEPERQAFLKAIETEPQNYLHRYVYADWLDERGEHDEATRQRSFEASDRWLRAFVEDNRFTSWDVRQPGGDPYTAFLASVLEHGNDGHFGTNWGQDAFHDSGCEIWAHLEVVLGREFSWAHRKRTIFSCSC